MLRCFQVQCIFPSTQMKYCKNKGNICSFSVFMAVPSVFMSFLTVRDIQSSEYKILCNNKSFDILWKFFFTVVSTVIKNSDGYSFFSSLFFLFYFFASLTEGKHLNDLSIRQHLSSGFMDHISFDG